MLRLDLQRLRPLHQHLGPVRFTLALMHQHRKTSQQSLLASSLYVLRRHTIRLLALVTSLSLDLHRHSFLPFQFLNQFISLESYSKPYLFQQRSQLDFSLLMLSFLFLILTTGQRFIQ